MNDNYSRWLHAEIDETFKKELEALNDEGITERFHKHLEFGTGGLRGEIGVGTNRINKYTIRRATQGLARYLLRQPTPKLSKSVVIAYDSRFFSNKFAEEAALVLAENGIVAYVFDELQPTPILSFAVRELHADAGIVITASHNPPEYNGLKVYGPDGGQIPPNTADGILLEIETVLDEFSVRAMNKQRALENGLLRYIGDNICQSYHNKLEHMVHNLLADKNYNRDLKIVYSPLHGTGNKHIREILHRIGFQQVWIVTEQEHPDPAFSTVSSPNPEDKEAFILSIALAKRVGADLIIATDPDADRLGAAVKNNTGEYILLTGNQIGALLLYYILEQRRQADTLPLNGVLLKTIVTSEMGKQIAKSFDIHTIDTLTGFKYIGEKIEEFNKNGEYTFVFGFEESYGYLAGDFVRDKDAIQASILISVVASHYKMKNMTLMDALHELYDKYSYYSEDLISITLKGLAGIKRIQQMMHYFRSEPPRHVGLEQVVTIEDYTYGTKTDLYTNTTMPLALPKSDVLKFNLSNDCWVAIRPSGTEPKIKIYISAVGQNKSDADNRLGSIRNGILKIIDNIK